MKKFLYLFLALILTLFIGIKVNSYFKSIETKINLLDRSYINKMNSLNTVKTFYKDATEANFKI